MPWWLKTILTELSLLPAANPWHPQSIPASEAERVVLRVDRPELAPVHSPVDPLGLAPPLRQDPAAEVLHRGRLPLRRPDQQPVRFHPSTPRIASHRACT